MVNEGEGEGEGEGERERCCSYEFILATSFIAALRESLPDFHHRMADRLRSPEQGADTVIWLSISEVAKHTPSGQFFEGIN